MSERENATAIFCSTPLCDLVEALPGVQPRSDLIWLAAHVSQPAGGTVCNTPADDLKWCTLMHGLIVHLKTQKIDARTPVRFEVVDRDPSTPIHTNSPWVALIDRTTSLAANTMAGWVASDPRAEGVTIDVTLVRRIIGLMYACSNDAPFTMKTLDGLMPTLVARFHELYLQLRALVLFSHEDQWSNFMDMVAPILRPACGRSDHYDTVVAPIRMARGFRLAGQYTRAAEIYRKMPQMSVDESAFVAGIANYTDLPPPRQLTTTNRQHLAQTEFAAKGIAPPPHAFTS